MARLRIGLLECDHVRPHLQPIAGDYRDMFSALVPSVELVPYDIRGGVLPSSPSECDGWLCTGSSSSVYDGSRWIDDLSAFARDVRVARTPFVGICFGHQLLAHALGGRTERAEGGWGVGTHRLDLARSAPWMEPPLDAISLLYCHQDQITVLPEGGEILGSTAHCQVAMVAVGSSMLGIQGHPEFGAAYLAALIDERVHRLGTERTALARASLATPRDEATVSRWIISFLTGARPT